MKPITNDTEFKAAIASGVVAVIFWASWCGPCKNYKPLVQRMCDEVGLPLYAVKVDDNRELAGLNSVRGVPTVLFFKGGVEARRLVGAVGEAAIVNVFSDLMKS